jgi:hypothetical protein
MLTLDHDPKSYHLILVDLVHIIQIQIGYLSKWYYILIIVSFESCGVDTLHTIAHISRNFQIHYDLWNLTQVNPLPKKILWPYSHHQLQYHSYLSTKNNSDTILIPYPYYINPHCPVHIYSNYKWVNWVICVVSQIIGCALAIVVMIYSTSHHIYISHDYPIGLLNYLPNVIHI